MVLEKYLPQEQRPWGHPCGARLAGGSQRGQHTGLLSRCALQVWGLPRAHPRRRLGRKTRRQGWAGFFRRLGPDGPSASGRWPSRAGRGFRPEDGSLDAESRAVRRALHPLRPVRCPGLPWKHVAGAPSPFWQEIVLAVRNDENMHVTTCSCLIPSLGAESPGSTGKSHTPWERQAGRDPEATAAQRGHGRLCRPAPPPHVASVGWPDPAAGRAVCP